MCIRDRCLGGQFLPDTVYKYIVMLESFISMQKFSIMISISEVVHFCLGCYKSFWSRIETPWQMPIKPTDLGVNPL